MSNYERTCKGVCIYNICITFVIAFAITKFIFCGALFKHILVWEQGISKRQFLERQCSSPCSFSFDIQLILGCENMFLIVSLSKLKFFTRVAFVSFVSHSCRTRVARVALVSHSCRTRVARGQHSSQFLFLPKFCSCDL